MKLIEKIGRYLSNDDRRNGSKLLNSLIPALATALFTTLIALSLGKCTNSANTPPIVLELPQSLDRNSNSNYESKSKEEFDRPPNSHLDYISLISSKSPASALQSIDQRIEEYILNSSRQLNLDIRKSASPNTYPLLSFTVTPDDGKVEITPSIDSNSSYTLYKPQLLINFSFFKNENSPSKQLTLILSKGDKSAKAPSPSDWSSLVDESESKIQKALCDTIHE